MAKRKYYTLARCTKCEHAVVQLVFLSQYREEVYGCTQLSIKYWDKLNKYCPLLNKQNNCDSI